MPEQNENDLSLGSDGGGSHSATGSGSLPPLPVHSSPVQRPSGRADEREETATTRARQETRQRSSERAPAANSGRRRGDGRREGARGEPWARGFPSAPRGGALEREQHLHEIFRQGWFLEQADQELADTRRFAKDERERLRQELAGTKEALAQARGQVKRREATNATLINTIEQLQKEVESLKAQVEGFQRMCNMQATHASSTGALAPASTAHCEPTPSTTTRQQPSSSQKRKERTESVREKPLEPTKAQRRKARADRVKEQQKEQQKRQLEEPASPAPEDLRSTLTARHD